MCNEFLGDIDNDLVSSLDESPHISCSPITRVPRSLSFRPAKTYVRCNPVTWLHNLRKLVEWSEKDTQHTMNAPVQGGREGGKEMTTRVYSLRQKLLGHDEGLQVIRNRSWSYKCSAADTIFRCPCHKNIPLKHYTSGSVWSLLVFSTKKKSLP